MHSVNFNNAQPILNFQRKPKISASRKLMLKVKKTSCHARYTILTTERQQWVFPLRAASFIVPCKILLVKHNFMTVMFAESDGGQSQRGTGTRDPDKRGGEAEVPDRASASSEHQRPKPSAAAGFSRLFCPRILLESSSSTPLQEFSPLLSSATEFLKEILMRMCARKDVSSRSQCVLCTYV